MEQSLPTSLPLAAAEARRREIRGQFLEQVRRLRALEKIIQYLLLTGEIFEDLEYDAAWYFNTTTPELALDIADARGKVRSIVQRLNPEMEAMINALWDRFPPPASEPEPETT